MSRKEKALRIEKTMRYNQGTTAAMPIMANCASVRAHHAVLTHHWTRQWRAGVDSTTLYPFSLRPGGISIGASDSLGPEHERRMSLQEDSMLSQPIVGTTNRMTILGLVRLRQEWEQASEGESLLQVSSNVGLILADIVRALDLSPLDREAVLGPSLILQLEEVLGS